MKAHCIGFFLIIAVGSLGAMKRPARDEKKIIAKVKKIRREHVNKNSLVELFGLDKNFSDKHFEHIAGQNITTRIIPCGWWFPEVKLLSGNCSCGVARFSKSGKKIVTFSINSHASLWNAHDGTLLSKFSLSEGSFKDKQMYIPAKFNADESELLFVSRNGVLICWDIEKQSVRYETKSLGWVVTPPRWSSDKKRLFMVVSYDETNPLRKAVIIDTVAGIVEKEICNNLRPFEDVFFIDSSHQAIVFLEDVSDYRDDKHVHYKQLPCPELLDINNDDLTHHYFSEKNMLVSMCFNDNLQLLMNVWDIEKNSIKKRCYPCADGLVHKYLSKDYTKLVLLNRKCAANSMDDAIDVWDLETEESISSVKSKRIVYDSYGFNTAENLLLFNVKRSLCLWDIYTNNLFAEIKQDDPWTCVHFNKQADKFIVSAHDDVQVWGQYTPTFKQLVLRKLLNLYWCVRSPFLSVDSPQKLLAAVVQLFQRKEKRLTRRQSHMPACCLDENELLEIWQSFPEPMQAIIWQSIFHKIKRYGK